MRRRQFLRAAGLSGAGAATLLPGFWRWASAAPAQQGPSPYGPPGAPDGNGLRLPEGFESRVIARSGEPVPGTGHTWHVFPDGGATFPVDGGGWVYVSNSEVPGIDAGGVGAVQFDAEGNVADAYAILRGTQMNCAGGSTPWGTWLSCEEHAGGQVWECDPSHGSQGTVRPAMGTFTHEAAAVDPAEQAVYLTEDVGDGGFYRFTPDAYPDLSAGVLEIASVTGFEGQMASAGGRVSWHEVPDPTLEGDTPTRGQVGAATKFDGGEGAWFDAGVIYFTTKGDHRVWAYRPGGSSLEVVYDAGVLDDPPIYGVDNLTVADSGDIYVCEDPGGPDSPELCLMLITPERVVAPFALLVGQDGSELAGPAFTPVGDRLYVSSQRGGPFGGVSGDQPGSGFGVTYEIRGPFRGGSFPAPSATETFRDATAGAARRPADGGSGGSGDGGSGSLAATGGGVAAAGLAAFGAAAAIRRRRNNDDDR